MCKFHLHKSIQSLWNTGRSTHLRQHVHQSSFPFRFQAPWKHWSYKGTHVRCIFGSNCSIQSFMLLVKLLTHLRRERRCQFSLWIAIDWEQKSQIKFLLVLVRIVTNYYLWDQVLRVGKVNLAILAHINELTLFLLFVGSCLVSCWLPMTVGGDSVGWIILVYELDINSAHIFLSAISLLWYFWSIKLN